MFKKNDIRCPVCLSEWNLKFMLEQGKTSCPTCHTQLRPMRIKDDMVIKLNWQDLRVLAIYAKRWTAFFNMKDRGDLEALRAFEVLLAELRKYKPKDAEELLPHDLITIVNKEPAPEKPLDLTPDETGNVPSPFFQKL